MADIEDIYPLSPMQEGLLFQALLEPESAAYTVQLTLQWNGAMNEGAFRDSWAELSRRHAVLRSSFVHEEVSRPAQIVLRERPPEITFTDLRGLEADAQDRHVANCRQQDRRRGFDLQRDVLLRVHLFRRGDDRYQFVWSHHHILIDGWCVGILERDFMQIYAALSAGRRPQLPAPVPYREYIRWLREQDRDDGQQFWSRYLAGYEQPAALPRFGPQGGSSEYDFRQKTLELDADVSGRLVRLAARYGATLNVLLQSVWGLLLSRYNRTNDVVFGAIVSGRPSELPGVEEMVGLFINAVPVRVQYKADQPFSDLLRQVQQTALASEAYHHLPLAEIQSQTSLGRDLFEHILIFENFPVGPAPNSGEAPADAAPSVTRVQAYDRTHYDLDLTIVPGETIEITFGYNGHVHPDDQIDRTLEQLRTVVDGVLKDPDRPVADLDILPPGERRRVVDDFNDTACELPSRTPVTAMIESQAQRRPDGVAVCCNGEQLTYGELNARANRLARQLRGLQVGPESLVGICVERSCDMIVAPLAVWKAGAAFVPLDPSYPPDRLAFMQQDARISVLLTQEHLAARISAHGARVVCVEAGSERIAGESSENLPVAARSDNLAYVIYTSGSTGRPKGVMVEHGGLINAAHAWRDAFGLDAFDVRALQMASFSFDVFVGDLVRALTNGGRLVICPDDVLLDPAGLYQLMTAERVSIFEATPGLVQPFMEYVYEHQLNVDHLKVLIVGSDTISSQHFQQLVDRFGRRMRIVNSYGVTEATIDSSYYEPDRTGPAAATNTPIGKPMGNMRFYILGPNRHPVPIGVAGELYIGGAGLARGYLNRERLTAERFVPNPIDGKQRLYRTGDLARWLPDGNVEFLGRADQQVKVRGYRIEPGEIENRLLEFSPVRRAVVDARHVVGTGRDLVAYVVADDGWTASGAREFLAEALPDYMIPAFFVNLDALPLSPNGKVDRKALPHPAQHPRERTTRYAAPRNDVERTLADIWRKVLALDEIGVDDNFFDLGGHSLKAMQIVSQIHKRMGIKVALRQVFRMPTIARLAIAVRAGERTDYAEIEPAPERDYYDLSHAQQRLWMLHHLGGETAYNMPTAFVFDEAPQLDALNRAFGTLVERHEALRTAFVLVDGEPKQQILSSPGFRVEEADFRGRERPEDDARRYVDRLAQSRFDLARPPLLRAAVVRLADRRFVFALNLHHIVGDGWSENILYREVLALYEAYRNGRPNPLRPLRIQYKDFADWQNARGFEREEQYWLRQLADMPDGVRLPYEATPDETRDFRGDAEKVVLSEDLTAALREFAAGRGTTVSNVMLAVFKLFLFQWTRQDDICIGVSIANRNHPDLESLIGFFVNILPIRTRLSAEMEFDELLQQVEGNLHEAFEHQDYPFDLLIRKLNPKRFANRQSILNVIYDFQGYAAMYVDGQDQGRDSRLDATQQAGNSDEWKPFEYTYSTSKFDLTLFVFDDEKNFHLTLEYDSGLFGAAAIRQGLATLQHFVEMVVGALVESETAAT